MAFLKRYYLPLFFLFTIAIAFAHNHSMSLWDQDEAAYAGFAKNMLVSNNWLIPDFMWSEIHRKTPLHFWNIATSYQVFGINEFSVRFPSTIFILLTYALVFFWGRKLFNAKTAFVSTVVLSTTIFIPILAKVSVTDATILFFSTLCAFCILQVLKRVNYIAVAIFWLSFSLALLTKGPPIILFCGVFAVILFAFHPNRMNLFRFHPWFFLPLAAAPLIYWGYLTTLHDNGNFISWMYDWYIKRRIGGSVLGQSAPPGMHFLLITAFFIPYLMFFPKAVWTGIRGIFKDKDSNLVLGAWFVSGWLLYEFSPSKLPAYTIAAHIPLAILIGKAIIEHQYTRTTPHKGLIIAQFSLQIIITAALLFVAFFMDLGMVLKATLILFNALMIAGIVAAFKFIKSSYFVHVVIGINLIFLLFVHAIILPQIDIYKNSTKRVADFIYEQADKESTIVLANKRGHPPSLPFYTGLHFKDVIEGDDFDTMLKWYLSEDAYVFVLNNEQKDEFIKEIPSINIKEVSSYFTDRKGQASYFIIMN
ncbi:MAG: glycosyltransferase family 39 protein [Flavobacteriales bacterium]|nr:glycosyltransferase family 39 protein [Flavobacteriales bacterium]